jgi:DNA-binding GntR family transcriptional regulator
MATTLPLSVQLYERLRRSIILGEYPQGTLLYEQRLAEDLDVSRVPVREALPLLQNQGFIETNPRRSAMVSTWTPQRINDLFDARLSLEVGAAGAAARRVRDGGSIAELEAAVADSEDGFIAIKATPSPDTAFRLAELSGEVHIALVAAAHNELINSLMQAVSGRLVWLIYLTSGLDFGAPEESHRAILEAIRAGNDRLAEALSIGHIEAGRAPTLATVAQMTVAPADGQPSLEVAAG